jgi:UDP-N-acetylmuramoyl-tripeptide--D-alanyl-D-alanine ligase
MNTRLTTGFVARIMRERGYEVREGPDLPVTGGAADSRNVTPGGLFAAFPGERVDGNAFVEQAIANGAVAVVCERVPQTGAGQATVVVAPDTTRAMAEIARAWMQECGPEVVGITGTVGKTTCKDVTADVLASRFRVHKSPGNFNSREGLPLAVMSLCREDDISVLELAMDSPGEILELCGIVNPSVGVVLNVGLTHVSKLGSVAAITEEKLSLARYLPRNGSAILNADDERVAPVAGGLNCRVLTFGRYDASRAKQPDLAFFRIKDEGLNGTRFWLQTGSRVARVDSPLPGAHTVPSVAAAISVASVLGIGLSEAASAVRKSATTGRVRRLIGRNGTTIIDDRYNASPASLAGALQLLGRLAGGRRIALIGRMAELGEFEEAEHQAIGQVAARTCDLLVAVGEPCKVLVETARAAGHRDAHWFDDKDEAAGFVREQMRSGDFVLVKASRSQAFETILPQLEAGQ